MTKLHKGIRPEFGEVILENNDWEVFSTFEGVGGWTNIKLVSKRPRQFKANFYLGWNGDRLAVSKESKVLMEYSRDIYDWLIEGLSS